MPVKNIDITVDLTRPGVVNTQKELRYGDENNLRIAVTDGGNQVTLSSLGITTVDLVVSRLTGTPIDVVGSIVDDKAVFTLDGASLSVPGYTKATVQFYGADGSRVSTADFSFKSLADPSLNAVGDSTEQTIIQQVLVNGPEVIEQAETKIVTMDEKILAVDDVIAENTQDYLSPVNAFADLETTYPTPSNGNKVYLKSTGETVRYNGTQWIVTHENDPTAIGYISAQLDETEGRLTTQLAETNQVKIGGGIKAEPEDLSAATLGLVTGTGGPINLLSIPQDESVTLKKSTKPIRDSLRPENVSLPFTKATETGSTSDVIYNKDVYKLSRMYLSAGMVDASGDTLILTAKGGNVFWVDYWITDEMRKWGSISFGLEAVLSAGIVYPRLRFYTSADVQISQTDTNVTVGNLKKYEGLAIPSNATYIRFFVTATTATGVLSKPILTYGDVLGSYDLSYYNNIFNPTPYIKTTDILNDAITYAKLDEDLKELLGGNTSYWEGKKAAFLGDSITSQSYNSDKPNRYPKYICDNLGMTELNYGISSSVIAVDESDPTKQDPMVTRFSAMDNTADIVFVAGGTNDWIYNHTPIGTMADRTNFTFYGALHNLCLGLKKKYIGKPIIFLTPIQRHSVAHTNPDSTNSQGKTLKDYAEIIKQVCAYYSILVVDMYEESGLYPFDLELALAHFVQQGTSPDFYYTHPNDAGQLLLGKRLLGFMAQVR